MAVNVKMGVDLSGFNSGIRQGQAILKGLNAEMKATEAEFKATGNSEQKLAAQTKTLNSQLQVQKGIADQAAAALKKLDAAGVQPTDVAYQKLYATMMNAQAGMNEAQAALNALDGSQQQAASSANALATSVNGIGKKISLDQVISGIHSITSGLERAAQKAVQLGETIWNSIMDSAKWADDTATQALMFGIDVETYQRMQKLVTNGMDTTVEAMLKSQSKLKKGIGSESKEAIEALQELGVAWDETIGAGKYGDVMQVRDTMEVFWEAGQKILAMKDDPNAQEDMAQALFGRSWRELVPLFDKYKSVEEYNEALEKTKINSEEEVNDLADLNDKVGELKGNFDTLSNEVMAALAPALTDAANALNGLLESVLEYLETPEGKEMLDHLSESVSKLFEGLNDIKAEDVVNAFSTAFDAVIDSLDWVVNNKDAVVGALKAVFGIFTTLKVSEGVLAVSKVVSGFKGLLGGGAGGAAGGSAAGTGGTVAGAGIGAGGAAALGGLAAVGLAIADVFNEAVIVTNQLIEKGDLSIARSEGIRNGYQGYVGMDIWEALNGYTSVGGVNYETDMQRMDEFAKRYWDYLYEGAEDAGLDRLLDLMDIGLSDEFNTAMEEYISGLGNKEDLEAVFTKVRNLLEEDMKNDPPEVETEPALADNAKELLNGQLQELGSFSVNVVPAFIESLSNFFTGHANGLPYDDGDLAQLHRGERVLTASENKSYTYNSNNYFGNVNLNNGQDIEALCDSIDRHNRRLRSGYGS